jgi:hypothetical protein
MEPSAPYASYQHEKGYFVLPIALDAGPLPKTLDVAGNVLSLKDEFHVTLVGKTVTELFANGDAVVQVFSAHVAEHPIRFERFENDFRLAEQADRRTLVVRARVANLEGLFAAFGTALGRAVPLQATHVTLYERQKGQSIGIPSEALWESFERAAVPELFEKLRLR